MKLALATLLCAINVLAIESGLETVVKIDSGWVSGAGTAVRSYKGIPYVAPPTGDLEVASAGQAVEGNPRRQRISSHLSAASINGRRGAKRELPGP
jgi:hypothetical protein